MTGPRCGAVNSAERRFCAEWLFRWPSPVLQGRSGTGTQAGHRALRRLLADRDPEEARKLLDPVLERMIEAVHPLRRNGEPGDGRRDHGALRRPARARRSRRPRLLRGALDAGVAEAPRGRHAPSARLADDLIAMMFKAVQSFFTDCSAQGGAAHDSNRSAHHCGCYSLAQAAWIPRITIWRDDGSFSTARASCVRVGRRRWRLASRGRLRR